MHRRTVVDPHFGARLRELRKGRGLSQKALALAAHVSNSYISELESAKKTPTPGFARALDTALKADDKLANLVTEVIEDPRQPTGPRLTALDGIATALTGYAVDEYREVATEQALASAVAGVKHHYQAGRYRQVVDALPGLLGMVGPSAEKTPSAESRAQVLAADAYQTTCSVLLKFGDVTLAMLAADRSMTAAHRSGKPTAVAASSRALAHALASSGHHERATTVALAAAAQLATAGGLSTTAELAVYGALLLRASVVAAGSEDRSTALETLAEAHDTAARLGGDDNAYWTYFCPTNVQLHQVSVTTNLGDAGQAIEYARHVNPSVISLPERKACLYIDVARAYTLWGKYEKAYEALLAAEQAAPQEVSLRPLVREVVSELQRRCPSRIYSSIRQLGNRIGAEW